MKRSYDSISTPTEISQEFLSSEIMYRLELDKKWPFLTIQCCSQEINYNSTLDYIIFVIKDHTVSVFDVYLTYEPKASRCGLYANRGGKTFGGKGWICENDMDIFHNLDEIVAETHSLIRLKYD